MDEDDYPNYGNAYPPTTASEPTASWHPALRSDKVADDDDDDFFDRYPGATPKKSQTRPVESAMEEPAEELEESAMPAEPENAWAEEHSQSISVDSAVGLSSREATVNDEDHIVSTSNVEARGPMLDATAISEQPQDKEAAVFGEPAQDEGAGIFGGNAQDEGTAIFGEQARDEEAAIFGEQAQDEEAAIFHEHETVAEQEQDLEEAMPEVSAQETPLEKDQFSMEEQTQPDPIQPAPEEHYEHQGEVTEMEEAQEASATAALLDDPAPLPTPGDERRDPLIDAMNQQPAVDFEALVASEDNLASKPVPDETQARPPIDRSFTTDFTEPALPQEVEAQSKRPLSVDWPDNTDDNTFGEILGNQQPEAPELKDLEEVAAEESLLETAPDDDLLPDDQFLPDDDNEEDLAAAWQAALDDDELLVDDSNDFDPSNMFGDDDDGFLADDAPVAPSSQQQPASTAPKNQYTPAGAQQVQRGQQQASSIDAFHGRSAGTPQTGLFDVYNQPGAVQEPQRPSASTAQSFSDKAKGGYQSPYDLPMEVVKPRRRPQPPPQQTSSGPAAAPPPRTSSYSSQGPPGSPAVAALSPPSSSHSTSKPLSGPGAAPVRSASQADSGFFADLPMTAKPRARPSYTAQPSGVSAPPPGAIPPPQQHPSRPPGPIMQQAQPPVPPPSVSQQLPQQPDIYGGLRQPERMPLLPDQPPGPPAQNQGAPPTAPNSRYSPSSQPAPSAPSAAVNSRYSPAPASQQPGASRYSPAPASQPGQTRPRYASATSGLPFAPRTSSPLAAFTDKASSAAPGEGAQALSSSPSKLNGARSYTQQEASSNSSRYGQSELTPPGSDSSFGAPPQQQARTISPTAFAKRPIVPSVTSPLGMPGQPAEGQTKRPALPHRRQFSRELLFAAPQNEASQDPLERWKGAPIFHWNASGTVLCSFPKQTPFYAAGQQQPSIKCTPGVITMQEIASFMPMAEQDVKFPGPLTARNKSKKKDVLAWMSEKIIGLERQTQHAVMDFSISTDQVKRVEEKPALWKLVKVFVENDGVLEGNPKIEEEVRKILLPNLAQMGQVLELQSPADNAASLARDPIDRNVLFQLRQALLQGQRDRAVWLAEEKKLWGHAMLIASTMGPEVWKQIIQSFVRTQVKTFGSDTKSLAALYQVFAGNADESVDELVPPSARAGFQMVSKTDGAMAGNPLEGLDQWRETVGLVTSNRTAADGASLVALGKLLSSYGRAEAAHTCFLFARSFAKHSGADDAEANFVLLGANHKPQDDNFGNDLDSIMLTEIYEWSSSLTAPSTAVPYIPHLQSYKLLHAQQLAAAGFTTKAQTYCDHITTAYTSTTRPSPYYHPIFTQSVAEFNAFLSQSPHDGKGRFLSKPALKTVTSSAGSWFSKFVAGEDDKDSEGSGAGGAGADDMAGPFGRVVGESSSLSRAASATDLYNPMMGGAMPIQQPMAPAQQAFAPSSAPSRYTPSSSHGTPSNARYTPSAGLALASAEQSRPSSSARYAPAAPGQQGAMGASQPSTLGLPHPEVSRTSSDYGQAYAPIPAASRRSSAQGSASYAPMPILSRPGSTTQQDAVSGASYEPRPVLADEQASYGYAPQIPPQPSSFDEQVGPSGLVEPTVSQVAPEIDPEGGSGGYEPPTTTGYAPTSNISGYDPSAGGGYEPPSGATGYEPPSAGRYEPPSYSSQPYDPDAEAPEEEDDKPKPKKKMFGDEDEDDDFAKRAAALKKSQADREADDAFRKAAEADAARDGGKGGADAAKKGWFGGWFGGKKDPNAPGSIPAQGNGPIRAKLGEESSFVYDETLKKWVNKKAGAEAATPSAPTPPPPRAGPPSRVTSMGSAIAGGPPSGPASRVASGVLDPSRPPTSGSGTPAGASLGSGPPSRIGTPSSGAAAQGPPMPMAHPPPGVVNGELSSTPPSRPSTGMSNASSLDDLLGGPPGAGGRKVGGTVRGKKKGGGRYVDVMAK